tara:strand:- start:103 stop:450 length:348 start_codon:yes stop_codon:yes gene_type:complete
MVNNSSNYIDIDLGRYAGNRRLLAGRQNGQEAWGEVSRKGDIVNSVIVLKDGGRAIVTNSYFLGMLSGIFKLYGSKSELLDHIDTGGLTETNKQEFLRAINRGYSPAINPMSTGS